MASKKTTTRNVQQEKTRTEMALKKPEKQITKKKVDKKVDKRTSK